MIRLTHITFCFTSIIFLIAGCSNKHATDTQHTGLNQETGIYLLFSKQGFNFVDVPFKVQSIQLINSKNEKTALTENLAINLVHHFTAIVRQRMFNFAVK